MHVYQLLSLQDGANHAPPQQSTAAESEASKMQSTSGNHAYTPLTPGSAAASAPTAGAAPSATAKQFSINAGSHRLMSTSKSPGKHGYPPTAGVSSSGKKTPAGKPAEASRGTGKETPAGNPGNHAYPPTAGTSTAGTQQSSAQAGNTHSHCL